MVVPSLEDAIADCGLVVGTSARSRHIPWPVMELLARATDALGGKGPITGDELNVAVLYDRSRRQVGAVPMRKLGIHCRGDQSAGNVTAARQAIEMESTTSPEYTTGTTRVRSRQ